MIKETLSPRFVDFSDIIQRFKNKTVAIVGSGPGVLGNDRGFIDSHDVVVRINNYQLMGATGRRTDVFYSFFGESIRKTVRELKRDGVTLCMCKCPNSHAIRSGWHKANGKRRGVDFTYIYQFRHDFWFCDTYVPTTEEFIETFDLLERHVPTTGFSAILAVLKCSPAAVYLTGFDFFRSGIHNVTERWIKQNKGDPIGHDPKREMAWLRENMRRYPIRCDQMLASTLAA